MSDFGGKIDGLTVGLKVDVVGDFELFGNLFSISIESSSSSSSFSSEVDAVVVFLRPIAAFSLSVI